MSQNVDGHSRILDMRPQFGTELNEVGDGRVQTVHRKGLNNGGERQDISQYWGGGGKKKKKRYVEGFSSNVGVRRSDNDMLV
jgi:hypothetical protein